MRWAVQKRGEFIRHHLAVVGKLNRSDIMKRFGVSAPLASADIKRFRADCPDAMRYDMTRKCWLSTQPPNHAGRDTTECANILARADDAWLAEVAQRDPSMIRDVAAALLWEREPSSATPPRTK